MTSPERFEEIPPSQAPRLVPWTEDSNFLSPAGQIAGMSAFADGATSDYRSKGARIVIKIVVGILVMAIVLAGFWGIYGRF